MKCENEFCIYQYKNKCTLKEIEIDSFGICADCIYPNIDEKILIEAKLKLLKNYDKRDNH